MFHATRDYNSVVASGTKKTRLNSNKLVTLSIVDMLWPYKQSLLLFIDGRQEGGIIKIESKGRKEMKPTDKSMEEETMPLPYTVITATISIAKAGSGGISERVGEAEKESSLGMSLRLIL